MEQVISEGLDVKQFSELLIIISESNRLMLLDRIMEGHGFGLGHAGEGQPRAKCCQPEH